MSFYTQLLDGLKKVFEETSHDVSSAKGVKKMIDHLKNQLPLSQQCQHELHGLFLQLNNYSDIKSSDFRSVRRVLSQIEESLSHFPTKPNNDDFQPLSIREKSYIDNRVEYDLPLREFKHDPRIFLLLAIFPKNSVLRKRLLIYWWIGEGLIPNEEEGERVFEDLLDLGLLIPYRTDTCPRISKCKINPLFRCGLISVAKEKMLLNLDGGITRFDPTHSQRACLIAGNTDLTRESESTLETLRTIFNVNERDVGFPEQWLAKLKRLVVLHLGRWQVSSTHHIKARGELFLRGLKTQKHLKYLSLRGISWITSLPNSIKELVSLEILDLKACHYLKELPLAIASMKMLTHLDVSECYLLESLPKGLQNLTSLQVLEGFIIGNSQRSPFKTEHLPSLKNLKRLSIYIRSEAAIEEENFKKLEELKNVKCLKVSWSQADVKGSLYFPPGLQKLDLEGMPHVTKPEWLDPNKLHNLETLNIKGGKLRNLVDEGEQWKDVKYLKLKYTNLQPIDQITLKSVFPGLQYVKKVELFENGERDFVQYEWNMGCASG